MAIPTEPIGSIPRPVELVDGKIDPSGDLLHRFIDLNNLALSRFSAEERRRIGLHTCPGSDLDSTHSGDVDYAELLGST